MAKAKFDSAKIKQFFAAYGERVAFGVCVVLAILVMYFAISVPEFDKSPKALTEAEQAAREIFKKSDAALDDAKLEEVGVKLPGREPKKIIEALLVRPVLAMLYAGRELNQPLFDNKTRRGEPNYLALRDLRASAHFGPIAMTPQAAQTLGAKAVGGDGAAAGDSKVLPWGAQWIVVTGLAPLEEQTAEYTTAFINAMDRTTNAIPIYTRYKLQRAEVYGDTPPAEADWTEVDLNKAVFGQMSQWAGTGGEVVDPSQVRWSIDSKDAGALPLVLTEPLPPLMNKEDYGDWLAHPPEIPLKVAGPAKEDPADPVPAGAAPNVFGGAAPAAAEQPAGAAAPTAVADQRAKFLLFRFFDFNVETGKSYRYRVMVDVKNPNFGLDPAHLEPNLKLNEGPTRSAPWSEASTKATVRALDRYFAGEVKPVSGDTEPAAFVGIKKWRPDLGTFVYTEFDVKDREGKQRDPKNRGAMLDSDNALLSFLLPGSKKQAELKTMLNTEALLLDFSWERNDRRVAGAEASIPGVPPRLSTRPSEVLLYSSRGELIITSELADWRWRDEMKQATPGEAPPDGAPAPGAPANPAAPGNPPKLRLGL